MFRVAPRIPIVPPTNPVADSDLFDALPAGLEPTAGDERYPDTGSLLPRELGALQPRDTECLPVIFTATDANAAGTSPADTRVEVLWGDATRVLTSSNPRSRLSKILRSQRGLERRGVSIVWPLGGVGAP